MSGFVVVYEGQQPEEINADFTTTGPMGGDSGHGAEAMLRFTVDSGDYEVHINRGRIGHKLEIVEFIARGDWEVAALERTIIGLAMEIMDKRMDISTTRFEEADGAEAST